MSTSDATVRKNFYSLEGYPGGDDAFEEELSRIEGEASPVIRKALEGTWPLAPEDRAILVDFLAFQFLRGPDTRTKMDQIHGTVLSKVVRQMGVAGLRDMLSNSGKPATEETLSRLIHQASQMKGIPVQTTPAGHINQILDLVPELLPFIELRPWTLVKFNDGNRLLTCDTPVSLAPHPKSARGFYSVGVMTARGITFPLTREVGLLLGNPQPLFEKAADWQSLEELRNEIASGDYDNEQPGSTTRARFFNSHTIDNARSWIFYHPQDGSLIPEDLSGLRDREVPSEAIPD